jgi:lipid II:glycine glycyltransferase (peptidoglycan interpeptide bridge formation enzyme)
MSVKETYRKHCTQQAMPLFMQHWWLDAVCDDWNAAIAMKGDQLAGIWAYAIEHKMGVSMLRTPMLTPYLGPHVFFPADLKESKADSYEHETIAELIKQLPDAQVWHLAMPPGLKQAGIFKKQKLRAEVQQTFLIELQESEAALFANIKESARRNIRTAEKDIIITDESACLEQLYKFQENTLAGKGKQLPYSLADLKKIMDACKAHDACALWVARNGVTIEAIVWQVWDANRSYYFMGGQNPEANGYKAMSLLFWHSMKESKKRGHSIFDLEGSMDEGVERFFRNFGGRRELYMVLYKNDSLLWKLKKVLLG